MASGLKCLKSFTPRCFQPAAKTKWGLSTELCNNAEYRTSEGLGMNNLEYIF
jgi:hypothetical protein